MTLTRHLPEGGRTGPFSPNATPLEPALPAPSWRGSKGCSPNPQWPQPDWGTPARHGTHLVGSEPGTQHYPLTPFGRHTSSKRCDGTDWLYRRKSVSMRKPLPAPLPAGPDARGRAPPARHPSSPARTGAGLAPGCRDASTEDKYE